MNTLIIDAAKYLIIVPVLVTIFIFLDLDNRQKRRMILLLVIGGILSLVIAKIASHIYVNPRPAFKDHVVPLFRSGDYNGFPSDHTLLASFLAFVALYYSRWLGIFLLIVAALVAGARVAAGVHHFVDVLASFIITAVATFITVWLLRGWGRHRRVKPAAAED